MITKEITDRILLVGPDYKSPKGGIGMVTKTYMHLFSSFNYLTTQKEGSSILKICVFLKALLKLLPFLLSSKIKIVHVHGSSDGSFVRKSLIILLSKLAGKKVIYHIHSGGFKTYVAKHTKVVPFIMKKCNCIVALSEYWKQFFETDLHCRNVAVVHNIMDYPREDHSSRNATLCTFLFLGKICDHKGVFDLLDVINSHFSSLNGKMRLFIAGIGETERLTKYVENQHLESIVKYMGWVDDEAKCQLLNLSDVVILPSYYEGVPICILEGFSYHLPAISTCVGGIPEILEDGKNGIMITPGDKNALYHAVCQMINSPSKRMKMGENAFQTCRNHLPDQVEESLKLLYSKLL
jgi:glycosyltransferase involved in cell wall biosynthesis